MLGQISHIRGCRVGRHMAVPSSIHVASTPGMRVWQIPLAAVQEPGGRPASNQPAPFGGRPDQSLPAVISV
jgi:hypothetical protein